MAGKMICPDCRVEMNFHAEKLVYSESPERQGAAFGDIEEMHTCPNCGRTESRLQVL